MRLRLSNGGMEARPNNGELIGFPVLCITKYRWDAPCNRENPGQHQDLPALKDRAILQPPKPSLRETSRKRSGFAFHGPYVSLPRGSFS